MRRILHHQRSQSDHPQNTRNDNVTGSSSCTTPPQLPQILIGFADLAFHTSTPLIHPSFKSNDYKKKYHSSSFLPTFYQSNFQTITRKTYRKTQIRATSHSYPLVLYDPQSSHLKYLRSHRSITQVRSLSKIYASSSSSSSSPASASQSSESALDSTNSSSGTLKPADRDAWATVALMFSAFMIGNMDKVNMSVACIPVAKELGWSATERGLVNSSFFWGYSLTQIPAGILATNFGGKRLLLFGVFTWSLGTLLCPLAAKASLLLLCLSRVTVGFGEGFAPSSATQVISKEIPPSNRALAVSSVWGGLEIGSIIGLLACGPLISHFGWPSVFYIFGVLGFVWCFAWFTYVIKKEPRKIQSNATILNNTDQQYSSSNGNGIGIVRMSKNVIRQILDVPWNEIFKSGPVWTVTIAHFCSNWGYYTLLAWLPSLFELTLGITVSKSSFLAIIPYLSMSFMTPFVGPYADGLVRRGWETTHVRKLVQGLSFLGKAICLALCCFVIPASAAAVTPLSSFLLVLLLSLSFAFHAWARAGLYCNHQDISPKYAAILLGMSNTAGGIPGILGVTLAGYMLDLTGSWSYAIFIPTVITQLIGFVVYSLFASSKRASWG